MLSTDQPSFQNMGQLLGIEPSTVESQSTILPINYSCRENLIRSFAVPATGLEPIPRRE